MLNKAKPRQVKTYLGVTHIFNKRFKLISCNPILLLHTLKKNVYFWYTCMFTEKTNFCLLFKGNNSYDLFLLNYNDTITKISIFFHIICITNLGLAKDLCHTSKPMTPDDDDDKCSQPMMTSKMLSTLN